MPKDHPTDLHFGETNGSGGAEPFFGLPAGGQGLNGKACAAAQPMVISAAGGAQEMRNFEDTHIVAELLRRGAAVIPGALNQMEIRELLIDAGGIEWTRADSRFGDRKVRQQYEYADRFSSDSLFRIVQGTLEIKLNQTFGRERPPVIPRMPLRFNEMRLQRYEAGSIGIEPHRDLNRCRSVIAVFMLEAGGTFYLYDIEDLTDTKRERIGTAPGDLILLRGSDFGGEKRRPMHSVEQIGQRRVTFTLRDLSPRY